MAVDPNNKWLQLREKDGYIYMHSPWCNSQAVAILPFRRVWTQVCDNGQGTVGLELDYEFLVVQETRPCHGGQPDIYSITGGCDKEGEYPVLTAVREVAEETGYEVKSEDMVDLGTIRDSKASDMVLYAYAVEIPVDAQPGEAVGDGTKGEEGIEARWVSEHDAAHSPDPMIAQMILRWRYKS